MTATETLTSLMNTARDRFALTNKLSLPELKAILQTLPQMKFDVGVDTIQKTENCFGMNLNKKVDHIEVSQISDGGSNTRFLYNLRAPISSDNLLIVDAKNTSSQDSVSLLVGAFDNSVELEIGSKDYRTYTIQLKDSPSNAIYLNFIFPGNLKGHILDIKRITVLKLGGVAKTLLCALLPVRGCAA